MPDGSDEGNQFDVVILGAGSGGYACALRAAQLGLSVALVEKDKVGGTCLHVGCIPTKALLHAAEVADAARESEKFGVQATLDGIDMAGVNAYKDGVVSRLYKGLTGLVKGRGITVIEGSGTAHRHRARSRSTARRTSARRSCSRSGSYSRTLPGLEIDGQRVLTSEQALAPRLGAAVGDRPRWRCHRLRVRQRVAFLRGRGHDHRGAAAPGAGRGRAVLQDARACLPQAQDRLRAPAPASSRSRQHRRRASR